MKHKFIIYLIMGIFLIGFAFAQLQTGIQSSSIGTFKQNYNITLYQTCNNCTYCNLTSVKFPDSTNILTNLVMTKDKTFYNYTLNGDNTSALGTYTYCYDCGNTGEIITGCLNFEITPSGVIPTTAQSGLSIGIMAVVMLIMFFFAMLSFKLMDYDKLYPIALFFLVVSIIISMYGLYLGVVYSRDYLYPSTSEPQAKIFIGVLYGLTAMMFFGMLFLIINGIKEIRIRKDIKNHGEGYNPRTKQYDY